MRRFSRRRRTGNNHDSKSSPIDAASWLTRLAESDAIDLEALTPSPHDDVPEGFAALGTGARGDDAAVWVALAPRHAGDALLAALATGARLAKDGEFRGEVWAVAPHWSVGARRRLGLVKAELPFRLVARGAASLGAGPEDVEAEAALEPTTLRIDQVAAQLADAQDRALFLRAANALEGLASKHGGAVRGAGRSVELVILARRVAELRADAGRVTLTTLVPTRTSAVVGRDDLAAALDGLEGQLRRRLNDRRVREGEEGLRTRLLPVLERAAGLRDTVVWPLAGSDNEAIDLVGLDEQGVPVVAIARESLTLENLGPILDAFQAMRLATPGLFADARPPVQIQAPKLVLAAESYAPGVLGVLSTLAVAHTLYAVRTENGLGLEEVSAEEAARSLRDRGGRGRRPGRGRGRQSERDGGVDGDEERSRRPKVDAEDSGRDARRRSESDDDGAERDESAGDDEERGGARGRGRRRGRRRGRGRDGESGEPRAEQADDGDRKSPADRPRFEDVSLFDLDDGGPGTASSEDDDGDDPGGARRRGRGRRRGRKGSGGDRGDSSEPRGRSGARDGAEPGSDGEGPTARSMPGKDSEDDDDEDDFDDDLSEVLAEVPDEDPTEAVGYSDDDPDEEDEDAPGQAKSRNVEREKRRLARKAAKEELPEPPKPRRRAVVVAHADRDSLLAAVLLARDVRLLEGLWVYDQADLMNFFREVTTDIKDDVPIYLVGFVPSPAHDIIQAASLYRDRIFWYDHHEWPPEDLMAMKAAIGEEMIQYTPGTGSSLPGLLETCTRRSRFSDKLVDLATGRFTQHDYERWGRLWWWRLGEIAQKRGDVRRDIEALLSGRPSDLAKEAARNDTPPVPPEVAYVSQRDFRLVHFAGYVMVVTEVDGDFDLNLTGRIARERYAATLSLSYRKGTNLFIFGGEEQGGRRVLDFGALSEHLAEKLAYVDALADNDHIARFSVRGLDVYPNRLDDVIREIAMARSVLER